MKDREYRWIALGMGVVVAMLALIALGDTAIRLEAEERSNDVINTMLRTGNYIVPYYEEEIRVQKPPLFYWASIAAQKTFGMGLFGFRFPSVVFGLLTLWLVWTWARLLGDRRIGAIAVGLLAVSYQFVQYTRIGTFEMPLSFFCGAGVLAANHAHTRRSTGFGLVVAMMFGLGFLTKGTPVFACMVLPLVLWVIGMKRLRTLFRPKVLLLSLLGLFVGLSWYLVLVAFYPESRKPLQVAALLPFGVTVEMNHGAKHYEPFWFFLRSIWQEAFPMALFIPAVVLLAWKQRGYDPDSPARLLLLLFLAPFVVFSIIPQKQDHYLLPMFPPLALLAAKSIVHVLDGTAPQIDRRYITIPFIAAILIAMVAGLALSPLVWLVASSHLFAGILFAVAVIATGYFALRSVRRANWGTGAACAFVMYALIWLAYFGGIHPVEEGFGSGAYFKDKSFDMVAWNAKFRQYPYLKKLLDVERGRKRANKNEPYLPIYLKR